MSNKWTTNRDLVERSSLGAPGARRLRRRTPPATARSVIEIAQTLGRIQNVVRAESFGDARQIGERYRDGPLIIDLTDTPDQDAKRLVDFMAGLAFGQHGSLQRLTSRIFALLRDSEENVGRSERGYTAPVAAAVSGLTYADVVELAQDEAVVPSKAAEPGEGMFGEAVYSLRDVLVLTLVKQFVEAGVPRDTIRSLGQELQSQTLRNLAGNMLLFDGTTVYECRSSEETADFLRGHGGVFGVSVSGALRELDVALGHLGLDDQESPEYLPKDRSTSHARSIAG
jgi:Cell division protein SepF